MKTRVAAVVVSLVLTGLPSWTSAQESQSLVTHYFQRQGKPVPLGLTNDAFVIRKLAAQHLYAGVIGGVDLPGTASYSGFPASTLNAGPAFG